MPWLWLYLEMIIAAQQIEALKRWSTRGEATRTRFCRAPIGWRVGFQGKQLCLQLADGNFKAVDVVWSGSENCGARCQF
jgi:hypothetical protein